MKFLLPIICSVILIQSASAQEESVLDPKNEKYYNYNKVMLVPFNENFYFSDSDQELAKYNKKTDKEISEWFREGLSFNVNARILSLYETERLEKDEREDVQKDLQALYSGLSYKLDKPYHYEVENSYEHLEDGKKRQSKVEEWLNDKLHLRSPEKRNVVSSGIMANQYLEEEESKEYMSVDVRNTEMLEYLNEKYGTDLFVFINQFELKKDFESCIDRKNQEFTRKVKVHFSIYNSEGDLLYGDVVTVLMDSNTNDMDQIIRSNFPIVADYMASYIPKKKAVD